MDVLILTVFISLVLAAGAVLFLVKRVRDGDFEHGDRLSLLPLHDDEGAGNSGTTEFPEATSDEQKPDRSPSQSDKTQ